METLTVEALSVAAFRAALQAIPHETRAVVTATEHGTPWATVDISPTTDTKRAVFPTYPNGIRGATRKRGQSGVLARGNDTHALDVVIRRAQVMGREAETEPEPQ